MSTIKANNIQIGQSGTATNNFVLAVPAAPDGTLKISRGNQGATIADVLTIAADNSVSYGTGGAGVTATGTQTLTNKTIAFSGNTLTGVAPTSNPVLTALKQVRIAIPASNIDLSLGNYFTRTISGTTTLTVSNVPASGTTASFILELTNGGSATVNWWAGRTWAGGTAPTLTASGVDVLGFYTFDGGTTWRGLVLARDIKA